MVRLRLDVRTYASSSSSSLAELLDNPAKGSAACLNPGPVAGCPRSLGSVASNPKKDMKAM